MKKIFCVILLVLTALSLTSCGDSGKTPADKPDRVATDEKKSDDKKSDENKSEEKKSDEKEKKESEEKFKPIVISYAGDCTLGSFSGSDNAFADYWQYGAGYYLANVKPIFEADDITFVNLEGPLTRYPQTAVKEFPMRGEPEYVDILKAGSVEICNLSNNHIYDCGTEGFQDTIDVLKSSGIKYCGEGFTDIIDVRGTKIGFFGCQGWYDSPDVRAEVEEGIKKLRDAKADIIIVEFHWGIEREYVSIPDQDSLAHFTIDSGADIVVGAHPHVVEGIELYNGKIIAYSLGNFCFGANNNPVDKDTFILQTTIDKKDGNFVITPKIIPCRISSTASYNDFCPTPVEGDEAEIILNKLADSSRGYPHTINFGQ